MGFRFRRSVSLGKGVRLNFSKSGIGMSFGVKGARYSIGPSGTRATVGIPGTGLYWEERSSRKSSAAEFSANPSSASDMAMGCLTFAVLVFGLAIVLAAPDGGKVLVLAGMTTYFWWAYRRAQKLKAAREQAAAAEREAMLKHIEEDEAKANAVLSGNLAPIANPPAVRLRKGEVIYYVADATLTEARERGQKVLGHGQVVVGSRKVYFLGDERTYSFDLDKIMQLEVHLGSLEVIRDGKQQNQSFVTEWPHTLAAYIKKALEASKAS
ncbi:MAG: DUF4236 domain-containing protein [Bacillota bacterium]|nr:DUF4236 domain-containing protein [Bacillota bacterium]